MYVSQPNSRMEGHNTYTTAVRLELPARERWDSQGRLLLRCDAVIPDLYRESSVLELHNPVFRRLQQSGYFSTGAYRWRKRKRGKTGNIRRKIG